MSTEVDAAKLQGKDKTNAPKKQPPAPAGPDGELSKKQLNKMAKKEKKA